MSTSSVLCSDVSRDLVASSPEEDLNTSISEMVLKISVVALLSPFTLHLSTPSTDRVHIFESEEARIELSRFDDR